MFRAVFARWVCATKAPSVPDTANLPPEEALPRTRSPIGPFFNGSESLSSFCTVDFSDISGRVRLAGQKIVIGVADSYHPMASWAEFIHAVYFGQAVKKVGLGVPTYWTFVMTQEPFDFANWKVVRPLTLFGFSP
jgi:hypothetical protein